MRLIIAATFLLAIGTTSAQNFHFKKIKNNTDASFRGLSVVNDKVAWIGGSKGWLGVTKDGGRTWDFSQLEGLEEFSLRSVYAFDDQKAIVANAGSPANILITTDGGQHWKTVYSNENESAFFDGIDFWNKDEGIIYGDAIDGKMLLLRTTDGGSTWNAIANAPSLVEGEASFAASGTGIRCVGKKKVVIATGGIISRLWVSEDNGENWNDIKVPIIQGEKTTGIYSMAIDGSKIILVGGDYTKPTVASKNHLMSLDDGITWTKPESRIRGYRECVEFINKNTVLATGPTGTDMSTDGGKSWEGISDEEGYHVVRQARNGSLIIIAGTNGQISIMEVKKKKDKGH